MEQPADSDPREFLVDVQVPAGVEMPEGVAEGDAHLRVIVRYVACDDAETFCTPVSQTYKVKLQRDRDGGSRRGRGRDRPGSGLSAIGSGRPDMSAPMRERILRYDHDQDGNVDLKDIPERMQPFLARADRNHDGVLDEKEPPDLKPPGFRSPGRSSRPRPSGDRFDRRPGK